MYLKFKDYLKVIPLIVCIVFPSLFQYSFAQHASVNEQKIFVTDLSLEKLQRTSIELKSYDEILTASVFNYVYSGEDKWLDKYNEYEPKLTRLINSLLDNPRDEDVTLISNFDEVNRSLVSLEVNAIKYVKNNNKDAALNIINSTEYHKLKSELMSILTTYIAQAEVRIQLNEKRIIDDNAITFTQEELKWIAENKVVVGIEYWPPILFMQSNNTPSGLSAELLKKIVTISGLQVEYVTGTWNDLLSQFKKGQIDLLPDVYFLESRKEFGYFSSSYFTVKELLYVKDNHRRFQKVNDLIKATIAIESGFTTIETLKSLHPDVKVIETTGIEDSIDKVLSGKADALLSASIVIDDLIKQNNIKGLRVIDEDIVPSSPLHLYTTKQKKILHSIIVKSLASIKKNGKAIDEEKWLSSSKSPKHNVDTSGGLSYLIWFVGCAIVLLVILGVVISSVLMKTDEKNLIAKFRSKQLKKIIFLILISLSILFIATVFFIDKHAEKRQFESIEYNLKTLMTTTHQRLKGWMKHELIALEHVGKNEELVGLVEKLLITSNESNALKDSPMQLDLQAFFKEREIELDSLGFCILAPNSINLFSKNSESIGTENPIQKYQSDLLNKVMQGKSLFIPMNSANVHLEGKSSGQQTNMRMMFFAAPIINDNGKVIAILTKKINSDGTFSSIFSSGFIGKSGETYALDKSGLLLSNVRFENELIEVGLLAEDSHSSLNIRISNPGINLLEENTKNIQSKDWPLTLMASHIASGRSGVNVDGYRDYRGVKVMGSWLWDDELGLGIAAEVDAEESLELIVTFRYIIFSILFISLLLVFSGTLFTLKVGTRATKALARSQLDLENLVLERTEALDDQIKFQQLLMDSVPIPLFYKDAETKFQGFNKAYEEVFDINANDLIGLKVTDLNYLPEEDRQQYQKEDMDVIAHQKTLKREMKMTFADGKLHDVLYWVTGFKNSKNESAGLVGNFIDISQEKENARQLEVAVKAADEANQAKADFLANMSHEIRTPMNAIIGMSYLALQTNLNKKQLDYVNKIYSSADSLLGIINDILDFSKIEAGKLEIETIPFNLNETIEHLVRIIAHKSQDKELELLIDLDPELPLDLIGDSLRLGQILINLANNAIKFTEKGEVIVKVKKLKQDDKNVTIEFSVCDTGVGMTEEQVGRLFKAFSQADASTTRKYGGTGLGLTISKTLTKMMQGDIWVESQDGEGSQFYFTATFGLAQEKTNNTKASRANVEGLSVLIVDDSLAAREILFNLAESLGFKPVLAASGEEALEKLTFAEKNNAAFELVLSDWKMPNMDGIELGEHIMKEGYLLTPPKFVIVTAYDRDEMLKSTHHINLASSLAKPVTASTLLNTTLKVMGEKTTDNCNVQVGRLDLTHVQNIVGAEVLLVEDNEINQQIAIELLEMAGLIVTVANNGKFAVEAVENKKFDAVLMDIQMPVMDGYTATRAIRKNNENISLPIIAMTANAMNGDKEKCIAAGMNEHLAKPIDPQEMYKTLAKWIKPTGKSINSIKESSVVLDNINLPHLPEFDIHAALARMSGNVKAYRNTLQKVIVSEADAVFRIRAAIDNDDYKSAVLIAHTLKGVAGNIGANFIVPLAEKLERLFTDKLERGEVLVDEELELLLVNCDAKLTQMIAVIENDQQIQINTTSKNTLDVNTVVKLLDELKINIENFDSTASDTLEKILECLPLDSIPKEADKLVTALESYDFDSAENLFLIFKQSLDIYTQ